MVGELEKRLFESERDRVVLRREREHLEKQAAAAQAEVDRAGLSQQLVAMVQANQARLEESNAAMLGMVQRQERDLREREEAWAAQVAQLKALILQNAK